MKSLTRRHFLHSSGILAGAALLPRFRSAPNSLRLGGPIFLKSDDPVELAKEHRRLGYSAAYVPKVELKDTPRIAALRKAFAEQNVIIAEVGAWVNMLDADAEKRKKNMEYVTERLALAEEIGALTCIDIAGSYHPKQWDGPDARNLTKEYFDATVENCRKVIDAVKPKTAKFALEMMGWSLPNDADSCLKFIKAMDRPAFAAHIDIANIINSPERFYQNTALINDTFKKLGKWIVSCHAKDVVGKDVHFAETMPGRGGMDYAAYLRNVTALPREVPLMLEHLRTAEEYDEARLYVMKVAKETGIALA
ncbi:sugar phosphate isomerase/epimerase family protein [Runella slithyformis]|uniref:Xylose isomerase domain-containing protein TIM barrel n=1 Tax=Runella slithyformis (strain ATCC 29530 / DSM 19594 / LMG 11500 / NCIMB 11436 / LSU 4) TaxID=761193 RepID=A0A7U4E5X4_RUNSL|nr:sugar phosphate isomerase/epimerase [Runella slithyformis]AEI48759.1 Xylose isomerase domain-containing protein TIM barrel [Runella slithyformis DSM 19594]